jgi:chromosome segregation ATPase
LTELRTYDEEITQLQARLREIPADIESQRFSIALTGIRTRVIALLDQAEQGRVALKQAQEDREKRNREIQNYKLFLDETDAWLKNVISKMHEQHSFNTNKVCWIILFVGLPNYNDFKQIYALTNFLS